MTSRFADIIIDISSEQVDRLFTYRIPDDMTLVPGQRVEVPFGPRKREGFVIEIKDECDLDPTLIKPVLRTLEDYPVILPELIELSRWMKKRYHCNLVDGLRQMIPSQMRGGRVRKKQIDIARLIVQGEELERAIESNKRAKKRLEVIEALRDGPKPVPVLNSISPGAVNKLAEQGIVRVEASEVMRTPYRALEGEAAVDPPLMRSQQHALEQIKRALDGDGGRFLLHGVTGSGKTEVYIRVIRETLASGRTAIVLVPEISLTPQMVDWFRRRFGGDAAVLHSRLSAGERFDEWRRIRSGEARVVIGARSAVFAPLEKPGVIIVDEEHESSYLSDKRPRYDARDIAKWRAEYHGAVMLLGSATPSISTYMKAMPGVKPWNKLTLIEMNERVCGRALPEVEIVDMREELVQGNKSIFSAALVREMQECLDQGRQAILFINRRGYSTFVSCRSCGHVEKCDQCDVSMTYHMADDKLHCHYCGDERKPPKVCPECGSKFIRFFGTGTQKVEEEVQARFPGVSVLRMDVDTTGGKDSHEKILSEFRSGKAQVLVGTQMIAKGLDFPNVTLVGVVAADLSLHVPDYRSVERTFQLITQVAGRAGRAEYPGKVILQTYDPEHYGIQLAAQQDYRAFYFREEKQRRRGLYPPFTVLARLLVSAKSEMDAQNAAQDLEKRLNEFLDSDPTIRRDVIQMRALEAPLKLLRGEARWQVFLKMYAKEPSDRVISYMEELEEISYEKVRVELEVNPNAML
ncbi:MAG: primosomal protein N' [Clostridia bacterium]|nr:primosomal protein N' [Clostridia bacterium]